MYCDVCDDSPCACAAGSSDEADGAGAHHSPGIAAAVTARGDGNLPAHEPSLSFTQVPSTPQHERSGASSAADADALGGDKNTNTSACSFPVSMIGKLDMSYG